MKLEYLRDQVRRFSKMKARRSRWVIVLAVAGLGLIAATACVPRTGADPIDIFSEQHYAQFYRSQKPPRLEGVSGAQPFISTSTDQTLTVPSQDKGTYDLNTAKALYRVNCSVVIAVDHHANQSLGFRFDSVRCADRHALP